MSGLPTLDPEIADLGLAIGLLNSTASGVELDSDWFSDPGPRITGAIADADRRAALVRFVDNVLAQGAHTERDGITFLHLFNLRELAGDNTLPDLTVQASLDARPAAYVEIGLAVSLTVDDPAISTELVVPLYRAKKTGQSVGQEFALLDGGVVHLSTEITLSSAPVPIGEFGLAGVAVSIATPIVGGPPPSFRLQLRGLHLPGAPTASDIDIGGPGVSIEDSLLSLVLGLVRQSAAALTGPAAAEVSAALDLLGLGDAVGIPPLPVADVLDRGAAALRDWFVELMSTTAARSAWLGSLATLLSGSASGDVVNIPIGAGPVTAQLGLRAVTGPGGYPLVTPRLGVTLIADVAGAVRLGGAVAVDLFTVDVGTGAMSAIPYADVAVTATGSGTGNAAKLLNTGTLDIGALRLGLSIRGGDPQALVELHDLDIDGSHRDVLDLSSPEAVVAAAGQIAADLIATALDALGPAGADLKALLGLDPPAGVPALDATALLGDPLGTFADWWQQLTTTHAAAVPEVLGHLRDLISGDAQLAQTIAGTGTEADPWSIPVVTRLALTCWRDGSRLVVAPVLSLRVDDLAGGCTVVQTTIRLQLVSFDLAAGAADFLGGVDMQARMRERGGTEARLSLGPIAIVADFIGVRAGWSPTAGFAVELLTPGLAADTGTERLPLVLPTVSSSGAISVPATAWGSVERLLGVLAASSPFGWLNDVVELFGWGLTGRAGQPRLSLAAVAAGPVPAVTAWLGALVTNGEVVGSLSATLAHLIGGSRAGLAGRFTGRGTPQDPWLAGLGRSPASPAIAIWLGPDGPVLEPSATSDALQSWRPGTPGLGAEGLAQAIFDEAATGPDMAALAAGREGIAAGLAALTGRWTGTDGMVAPPPAAISRLTPVVLPDLDASGVPALDVAALIPGGLPAGAVVVRVAVATGTAAADLPWVPAAGRLVDLTATGLSPSSFTVTSPAAGEWVVALAPRAVASLGGTTDPSGVVGQAARLQKVITDLASAGPVVLVAAGGAGHAARMAADAVAGVTHLVTLGTPWSAATFDTARTGVPADALRLMRAVLPDADPADPDDDDLALGRALVTGFMRAARGAVDVTELEAPRPALEVRTGLTAVAAFGALSQARVDRAMTAVFAAGLSARARARAATATAAPTSAHVGVHLPFDLLTPPGGHGTTLRGSLLLQLLSVDATAATIGATPGIRLELDVADTDSWLIGGPGTTPAGGAPALELRRLSARLEFGLYGEPSSAQVVLHEGAALGAEWARLVVRPPTAVTGTLELEPLLPEAQALLAALATRLTEAAAGDPAAALLALFKASGISQPDGALLPDALAHLLHDPGVQLRTLLGAPTSRGALLQALAAIVPSFTVTGDAARIAAGPLTADIDVGARTVGFTATGSEGLLPWHVSCTFTPGGVPTFAVGLGDVATDAFALTAVSGPLRVRLDRGAGGAPVSLWPTVDVEGLGRLAAAAVPAEALRLVIEGLRHIQNDLGTALDDLCAAVGLLRPPDDAGHRAVIAPVRLFEDPAGWLKNAGVLAVVAGGPFDVERLIDLLEAIKPFVGQGGTPRGVLPVAPGLQVGVTTAPQGPSVFVDVDPATWLGGAGRSPVAAGLRAGLTIPSAGVPLPAVSLFIGVPDGPGGTTTPQHRRAAHLQVDASGLRLFLRPSTGSDIEIYPNLAGFGSLLAAGMTELLPLALDELASMSGDAVRTEIAALVSSIGRGLAIATGTPAVFSSSAITSLAADPAAHLRAHLTDLLTEAVAALDPPLRRLLGVATPVAVMTTPGVLTVTVRTVVARVETAPFAVHLEGSVTGLPVVGAVSMSMAVDDTGLSEWSAGLGPAVIDLGGPVLRPFLRGGLLGAAGWQAEIGLGLDAIAPTGLGHRELTARWREATGAVVVLVTERTATEVTEDSSDEGVATAAIGAVLDLVGGWVLGVTEVKTQLAQPFGSQTVGFVLQGSILDPAAPAASPRLMPAVLTGWPGKLLTLASRLAGAAPSVIVGDFQFGIANTSGVLGVSMTTTNAAGIDLTPGGELSLRLEVDASWIEPPSGTVSPGIVLNLLRVAGATITPAPGIAVNGVGLRLGKAGGPLIDAGLRLDSIAVHLFGSVVMNASQNPEFAGGVQVQLGGLAVPLGSGGGDNAVAQGVMKDAGGSGAPPRPAFSPSIAVQEHGQGIAITLKAGSGDGPWFLPIQRAFGPVYLDQIGLGVAYQQGVTPRQMEAISLYLDAQVSLMGLSAAVDKLRLTYHVTRPFFDSSSWEIDVDGFAIASSIGGLSLAGGLRKFTLQAPLSGVEYLGMLKIGFGSYGLNVYGGYAQPVTTSGSSFASFFAFGVLHAPIGGPPAFFITGIGIGFGINRELRPPLIETLHQHPFMLALRALGPAPEPMKQLSDMRALVPPAQGTYWVAAGISFTSFVLITGEILVTVQFGDGLEICILGVARAQLPTPIVTLVSVELALLARFSTKEGVLIVQAQLTENSWLLHESVRLTGGFAFATWWKGPNSGQFVVTIGGYHPRFHHDGYPVVPRVGLRWSPISNISVVGETYFALCSEALMAGVHIEVAAKFGPARARLAIGCDGIVFFDPFWFSVRVYATVEIGLRIKILWGTINIELNFGVDVEVTGPPLFCKGHFSVYGIKIPFQFGDEGDPAERALNAGAFADKYLRAGADAQVIQASVVRGGLVAGKSPSGGVAKPPDGSAENPFRVVPEFILTFVTTAPNERGVLGQVPGADVKTVDVPIPGLGVAPMYSATLDAVFTMTVASLDGQAFELDGIALSERPPVAFPAGVWGPAPNPKAPKVPAGETIDACDGFTLDTTLPASMFTGAALIDYHQIKLPLGGRKPLPFVTNKIKINARVTASLTLKNAAKFLTQGNPDEAERFLRAAVMLSAGGRGATTVSSLRGDRSAAPSFGSLADDLVDAPAAVSPTVEGIVVDRTKPAPRRFAPVVKSLMGTPLSLTLQRAGATTVLEPGDGVRRTPPTLASVRSATVGNTQASLSVVARSVAAGRRTVVPTGSAPVTRLATNPVGSVANAAPAPIAASRLAAMSDQLLDSLEANRTPGAVLHDGELAVITVANRPRGDSLDTVVVAGGATRVLCLSAGGRTVEDRVVVPDGDSVPVEMPRVTERLVLVGIGDQRATSGTLAGWYAGQSLPAIGWGAALAGGAAVSAQGERVSDNRERGDGGWVSTSELAKAAQVTTVFTDPVTAIAVVIDDALGDDAAAKLSMRLLDAERTVDAAGAQRPPELLVDGVRSILIYSIVTKGPDVGVVVEGCGRGQLAGVVGIGGSVSALAEILASIGVEAAVAQPLVGGGGTRTITYTLADGPVDKFVPRSVRRKRVPAKKTPAKKAAPVTKAVAKKPAKKAAPVTKAVAKKPAKKAAPVAKAVAAKKAKKKTRKGRK